MLQHIYSVAIVCVAAALFSLSLCCSTFSLCCSTFSLCCSTFSLCCRSCNSSLADCVEPVQPMTGFPIYEETGLTPAPASRTAAVMKHTNYDKENQFMADAAAADHLLAEEEPMTVDWVNNITSCVFCYD